MLKFLVDVLPRCEGVRDLLFEQGTVFFPQAEDGLVHGVLIGLESDRGIATLEQLIANPNLLDAVRDEQDNSPPLTANDLRRTVALIDATPEYLSQRMKVLESALLGDDKTVLTTVASPIARSLRR